MNVDSKPTSETKVRDLALAAKTAAPGLARAGARARDAALHAMADALVAEQEAIRAANARDLARGEADGLPAPILDRLSLAGDRVAAMADGLRQVAALADPLGRVLGGWTRPNGLRIEKVAVPLGVVGFIYEGRPNVTVEATGLCLKSGNAVVLRGSRSARESNRELVRVLRGALRAAGLPEDAVVGLAGEDRSEVDTLLSLTGVVDVAIPRGGAGLIQRVIEVAKVPVIETGVGNCHVYVDASADPGMAERIVLNAKVQRPGVCNAAETLLVHVDRLPWLPAVLEALAAKGVAIRGDDRTRAAWPRAEAATAADWDTEYLDLVLAVKVVDSLDEALVHVARHGTKHSEAIVTRDYAAGERWLAEVDAAAVYVNASTRFTDGGEFGFGAEVGISTQKLHARGPMGLAELTTTKYLIRGDGQTR